MEKSKALEEALRIMAKFPEWKQVNKSILKEGQQAEHLDYCGWCRQGLECPYKRKLN